MAHLLLLIGAGVAAGVLGSVVGLASLASYPALLLVGLPPIAANVTNTVALVAGGIGAAAGSRVELAGQGRRVARICVITGLSGAAGALLLLVTPAHAFEMVVPGLIAGASVLLLAGPRLRRTAVARRSSRAQQAVSPSGRPVPLPEHAGEAAARTAVPDRRAVRRTLGGYLAIAPIGLYGGYFGAAAGVLMLALLTVMLADQSLARTNATKNVAMGTANAAASVVFAATGPVHWAAAAPLGVGFLLGGWLGPAVVRRVPPGPLRLLIALGGFGLAVKLAANAGLL